MILSVTDVTGKVTLPVTAVLVHKIRALITTLKTRHTTKEWSATDVIEEDIMPLTAEFS